MPTILVHSSHRHPRLRYVLRILEGHLGWKFRLVVEPSPSALPHVGSGLGAKRPSVRWDSANPDAHLWLAKPTEKPPLPHANLPPHPFLAGTAPTATDLKVTQRQDIPTFFPVPESPLGYDPLSCIFFAVTRYEEYGNAAADAHGRFPATASHAYRNDYLQLPVVAVWAAAVVSHLRQRYPRLSTPAYGPTYYRATYDIDLLWAYQHRGWRGRAAGLRDLLTGNFRRAGARFFGSPGADPYFTLRRIKALHAKKEVNQPRSSEPAPHPRPRPQIFWLLSDGKHAHDPNPYPIPPAQSELMRATEAWADVGLHPSYASSDRPELLRVEADRYRDIFGLAPLRSRQHFLRFRLPDTYRELRLAGITHDHTMGYADAPGWRAGTNRPFKWYDVEREEVTGLTVHPFAAMDATLRKYRNLGPEAAMKTIRSLYATVEPYGGPVALLWHNSSFADDYGWAGWWKEYAALFRR